MAGYNGYSMSNNAVDAYESGEKPMSKWTKTEMLKAIPAEYRDSFKGFKAAILKNVLLRESSWHHTSSHYNRTYFYAVVEIDEDNAAALIARCESQSAAALIARCESQSAAAPVKKEEPKKSIHRVKYLVWGGTRKRPKAEEVVEECEVIGNWAMTSNGKKSTTARGFEFLS